MGAMLPWRPFRELDRIMRNWETRFPRLFEEFEEEEEVSPPIESYVENGNLIVKADVPGLEPKDIEISVLNDILTIKGERKTEKEIKRENFLRHEIAYGSFERQMRLPEGAVTDKVKANFKNGVIELSIPLTKEIGAKKIPLEVENK